MVRRLLLLLWLFVLREKKALSRAGLVHAFGLWLVAALCAVCEQNASSHIAQHANPGLLF